MSRPAISYPIPTAATADVFDDSSYQPLPTPPEDFSRLSTGNPIARTPSGPRSQSSASQTSTLDSLITRLLVVTKQLLQGLDQWSQHQASEEHVSDIYVRLGNGFEMCVGAFRKVGISTADLDSVPRDLREILERALSEDPSQDTLNMYLPDIRAIIFNLLQGLKSKQIAYKRMLADRQPPEPSMSPTPSRRAQHTPRPAPPDAFRPSRSRQQLHDSVSTTSSYRSDTRPSPTPPPNVPLPTIDQKRTHSVQMPTPVPAPAMHAPPSTSPTVSHAPLPEPPNRPPPIRTQPHPDRYSRESAANANVSRFSADSELSVSSSQRPTSDASSHLPVFDPGYQRRGSDASKATAAPPPPLPSQPSSSLSAEPSPVPPALPSPAPELPVLNLPHSPLVSDLKSSGHDTATPPSLAALQRSDALERRASKRFSSYTFSKLASSPSGKKVSQMASSPQRPVRRERTPLAPLNEGTATDHGMAFSPPPEQVGTTQIPVIQIPDADGTSPSAPASALPTDGSSPTPPSGPDGQPTTASVSPVGTTGTAPSATGSTTLTAYLQLGRQVKKAVIGLPLTMPALRLLFMERFEYDPGLDNFPDVYIRDNKTGVQYELEDMDDVKDGCVLTLDIEPLDQVKQHFDLTVASLVQEIKDLKTSFTQQKRMSMQVPAQTLLPVSPVQPAVRTLERMPEAPQPPRPPQRTPSGNVVLPSESELRGHYDEVQSLRRDLAILRQLHVDFLQQTKESFSALRAQNTAMREVVNSKMGGSRALLDNSKTKLEGECQETIQAVEEISDIIDGAREDALRRGVTPSRAKMDKIRDDLARATQLVETFAGDVTLAEPTWRATWLSELQRVTDEQRLLGYQNKLAADLKNDIKDATGMLSNVQAFVEQRQATKAKGGPKKQFTPAEPEEGGGISTLLLEIRTKESDPNQRLRAIEEQQKARERDMATRTDEFQNELSGFVGGRKLRKTGGTEEADRIRQRRQDQTIKRMLTGDSVPGDPPPGVLTPQATGASAKSPRAHTDSIRSRNSAMSSGSMDSRI